MEEVDPTGHDISEQHILDCYPEQTFLASGACDGGYVDKVFTSALHTNFNEEARGLVSDDDYEPYSGVQKTCKLDANGRGGEGSAGRASVEEAVAAAEAWHLWGWRGVPIKLVEFRWEECARHTVWQLRVC